MARLATATVASLNPLRVVMRGEVNNPIPAEPVGYSATPGDRVRVEVRRSGLAPIVQVNLDA